MGWVAAVKPGLTWKVKDSLVSYVEALDDGSAEAVDPASRSEAGFFFPWDRSATVQDSGGSADVLQFQGAVRFAGHWGALDIELRDPRIELDGRRGVLLVRERGARDPGKVLPFADLEVRQQDEAGASVRVDLAASLTGQGRFLLGGQYAVGQALSPLLVVFPEAP
jgi:Htaa